MSHVRIELRTNHILAVAYMKEMITMIKTKAPPRPSPRSSTLLDLLENVIAAQFEAEAAGKTV